MHFNASNNVIEMKLLRICFHRRRVRETQAGGDIGSFIGSLNTLIDTWEAKGAERFLLVAEAVSVSPGLERSAFQATQPCESAAATGLQRWSFHNFNTLTAESYKIQRYFALPPRFLDKEEFISLKAHRFGAALTGDPDQKFTMKSLASLLLWRIIILIMPMVSLGQTSEYVYDTWKAELYNSGRIYDKPPQCMDIPDDLKLCHNVGYNQMLLPNLLEHETMAEVKQQAGSWVPLVHKNCHPATQVFLCSLFAPVCLERPIYPCRWLCENVRDGCTPIMEAFGFPWPEMLTCEKFPQDDVCISTPNATEASKPTGKSTWLGKRTAYI